MKRKRVVWIIVSLQLTINLFFQACEKGDAPVAGFSVDKTNGSVPFNIHCFDQSTNKPTKWQWDFGDWTVSTLQNPSHTYSKEGTYSISLTASNSSGSDTETKTDLIVVAPNTNPPNADFSASPQNGNAPLNIQFTDKSSNSPTSWEWDFGDESTSILQHPIHTFNQNGIYSVSLIVTNEYGSSSKSIANLVVIPGGSATGSFTDPRDEQEYKTFRIGPQTWFAENLNYQHENSWCYDESNSNCNIFGRLYQWETALTVCPDGWHLPDDDEWKYLEGYIDSQYGIGDPVWDVFDFRGADAGKQLKSTEVWEQGEGSNTIGFNGLPAGWRSFYGAYYRIGAWTSFWTSTSTVSGSAIYRRLGFHSDQIGRGNDTQDFGFSVRCLKD